MHPLSTTPQKRRCQVVKVSYLTQLNEKKMDCKYIDTLRLDACLSVSSQKL